MPKPPTPSTLPMTYRPRSTVPMGRARKGCSSSPLNPQQGQTGVSSGFS